MIEAADPGRTVRAPAGGTRQSRSGRWWAIADAVGHCVFVFAFLPTLVALPTWIYFEAQNPLNMQDPVVLAFLPVRGAILLLNTFREGVVPGVVTGILCGVVVSTWVAWRDGVESRGGRLVLGAAAGLGAASLLILAAWARVIADGRAPDLPFLAVAFEIGSGVVCGMVAAPTAVRLLHDYDAGPISSASKE